MYLDPSLGSMLIQVIGAAVVTVGVVVGIFWKKIRLFFQTRKLARMEKKLRAQAEKNETK